MHIRHTTAITNGLGNPLGLLVPVCTYAWGIILPTVRALLVLGDNTTQKMVLPQVLCGFNTLALPQNSQKNIPD
jgi:hypothetical protein